jgi:hypothetical protein
MQQFNFETIKAIFNPEKFIDQAEKNTQAVLAYVEPKELSKTLVALTSDATDFFRAQLAAVDAIADIVKTQSEDFAKKFTVSAK